MNVVAPGVLELPETPTQRQLSAVAYNGLRATTLTVSEVSAAEFPVFVDVLTAVAPTLEQLSISSSLESLTRCLVVAAQLLHATRMQSLK